MQSVRIYEMPACKMVSSGTGMFGEGNFNRFDEWLSSQKRGLFPKDFLFWDGEGFVWLYMYEDGMNVPTEFEIIDFQGGLYAVATDIDQKTDKGLMDTQIDRFLSENRFERDTSRSELGNIITSPLAKKVMGYEQMDYYIPIKAKQKDTMNIQHSQENKEGFTMRLDGCGLFVKDMGAMIRFYRDVLGFEIKEDENTDIVYLLKDGTLFFLYRRKDFEKLTDKKYEYLKGVNAHSELALYVDTYEEVDVRYLNAIAHGATSLLEPTTEPWGQRTCFLADPEGNIIEIGSWNKPYKEKDL